MKERFLASRTADHTYTLPEVVVALAERRLISHAAVRRIFDADNKKIFDDSAKEKLHGLFIDPSSVRRDEHGEQIPLPMPPLLRRESDFSQKFLDGGLTLVYGNGTAAEVAIHSKQQNVVSVHEASETPAHVSDPLTGSIWGTEQLRSVRDPSLLGSEIIKLLSEYKGYTDRNHAISMLKYKIAWAAISLSAFDLDFQSKPERLQAIRRYTNMPNDFLGTIIRFHHNQKADNRARLHIA